jgi:hypothetical protein
LNIVASGDSNVEADVEQDFIQGNECLGGSSCDNEFVINQLEIFSEQATISSKANQELIEQNGCEDLDT